jgi:hypothetical protein
MCATATLLVEGSCLTVSPQKTFIDIALHDPRHNRGGHSSGRSPISEPSEWVTGVGASVGIQGIWSGCRVPDDLQVIVGVDRHVGAGVDGVPAPGCSRFSH